jgi:hypothetical protein
VLLSQWRIFIISAPSSIVMCLTTKSVAALPPNGEVGGRPRRELVVMCVCTTTVTLYPSTSFELIPKTERTGYKQRRHLKIKPIVSLGSIGNHKPPTFSFCLSIAFFFSQVHEFCLLKSVDLILDTFYASRRYFVMTFYLIKLHDLK